MNANTDLIIIGGGAAGMMAAATASELKLSCILVEKNNRIGRKVLMSGNNRCNLSTDLPPADLLNRYGEPNATFLKAAITGFTTNDLKEWFTRNRLRVAVKANGRVYPSTECANDVVNCFKDILRAQEIPLLLNTAVQTIVQTGQGFKVSARNISLTAPNILIATGGVTYPKTGSVGDGQRLAKSLGHKILPYRPGLVAFELHPSFWSRQRDLTIPDVELTIHSNGRAPIVLRGGLEIRQGQVHGPVAIDASNRISRLDLKHYKLSLDILPGVPEESLKQNSHPSKLNILLTQHLPKQVCKILATDYLNKLSRDLSISDALKSAELPVKGMRPMKEAMVTIGGVSLDQIDPQTMMSTRHPGLYFSGEVMDIEGPCGGFNLHAAFATARLAVRHIAGNTHI